jgi:preprotein translocase subunit SecE
MKSTPKNPATPARTSPPARPGSRPATTARPANAQRAQNAQVTQDFIRGVISEMKRVTWPSRDEWVAATILTVALVVGVGVFTYVVDLAFGWIFTLLTGGAR